MRGEHRMNSIRISRIKRVLISAWLIWERLFHKCFAVKPIDHENQLLYYRICNYRGKPISLSDEEKILFGDRVLELHFNNDFLFHLVNGSQSVVQLAAKLIHYTRQLMPKIMEKIAQDPDFNGIKGVYGITMIHQGIERLGFTVMDLPRGWFSFVTRCYLTVLLCILHPEGTRRLQKKKKEVLVPKVLAISIKDLQRRFSVKGAAN
jgi:hypothetical protein